LSLLTSSDVLGLSLLTSSDGLGLSLLTSSDVFGLSLLTSSDGLGLSLLTSSDVVRLGLELVVISDSLQGGSSSSSHKSNSGISLLTNMHCISGGSFSSSINVTSSLLSLLVGLFTLLLCSFLPTIGLESSSVSKSNKLLSGLILIALLSTSATESKLSILALSFDPLESLLKEVFKSSLCFREMDNFYPNNNIYNKLHHPLEICEDNCTVKSMTCAGMDKPTVPGPRTGRIML
ncbi:hypothetical protein Avbf_01660, partial [Armadillidium vulgare]